MVRPIPISALACTAVLAFAVLAFAVPAMADLDEAYQGSTEEEFRTLMAGIAEEFPDEADRKQVADAVMALVIEAYPPAAAADGLAKLALLPDALKAAPQTMRGVTYRQLLERGQEIAAAREAKEAAEAAKAELEGRVLACLQDAVALSDVSFELVDAPYTSSPAVRLAYAIRNTLDRSIARLHLAFEIRTEGRAVPWREATLADEIPGGIEPGETRRLEFYLGDYENAPLEIAPPPLEVELTVIDVVDAAGEAFMAGRSGDGFGAAYCARRDVLENIEVPE